MVMNMLIRSISMPCRISTCDFLKKVEILISLCICIEDSAKNKGEGNVIPWF
jgi:hypothetical protein